MCAFCFKTENCSTSTQQYAAHLAIDQELPVEISIAVTYSLQTSGSSSRAYLLASVTDYETSL